MDFLELFNEVARKARPVHIEHSPITDKQTELVDFGLDSLDILMCVVYICELYGIPEEVGKDMPAINVSSIETFVQHYKTQEPASIADAVEQMK